MRRFGSSRLLACALATGLALLGISASAQAASFVVNSAGDAGDASTADSVCATAGTPLCTLRAAIEQANAQPTGDIISFSLPDPTTIQLTGALPALTSTMTISGPGPDALTVRRDSGGDYRIFDVEGNVDINSLTITNGRVVGGEHGGGIRNTGALALYDVTVTQNSTVWDPAPAGWLFGGGGIANAGELVISNSTISDNSAIMGVPSGSSIVAGGGVDGDGGSMTITDSTVVGNTASTSGAGQALGGGIVVLFSASRLTNVTVSDNEAVTTGTGAAVGGGIAFGGGSGSDSIVTSSTIAFNRAAIGANLSHGDFHPVVVRNSIVSNPLGGGTDCAAYFPVSSFIHSGGFNLVSDASCAFAATGDQQEVDPQLEALGDNGGLTQTHALPAASPAVDQGSAAASGTHPAVTTDQRGEPRPVDQPVTDATGGDGSDIGAYELQNEAPPDYAATVLADDPAGYWRFGEPSGTLLIDSSPNANNGVYAGGPLLGQPGIVAANTAATFDGVNDNGRVPDSASLDVGGSFTLEGWIKRGSAAKSQTLMNKGNFQLVVMNAASGGQIFLRKANVSTIARSAGGVPADGEFHHVVATLDEPGTAKIYIDGVLDTVPVSPQPIADNASPLYFGAAASAQTTFDEFAIYNQPLSAADVAAHYAAAVGGD